MGVLDIESEVHMKILNNDVVRDGIKNILQLGNDYQFVHEDEYINGIWADFTIIDNDKIRAIMECKGGHIGVTDYVRGIGQVFQYEYFAEKNISHKSLEYMSNFNTVYIFPDSVIRNNLFNIAKFKYPESLILLEINENNKCLVTTKSSFDESNLVTVSQYYFRDNRIFELYILLKYLLYLEQKGITECNRKELDDKYLKKIGTINNGNWRNAFISVSNLGLINNKNLLTEAGKNMAIKNYEDFALDMYKSYINVYFEQIYKVFNDDASINATNQEIAQQIKERFRNRDVLYLTQSNARYVSSWMNIMRDDYGCINFEPRSNYKTINYYPMDLNDEAFKRKIKENSVAYEYIDKYTMLIKRGEI